jgi:hypothetical protein
MFDPADLMENLMPYGKPNKTALPNICKRKQCTHNIHTHHISVAAYKVTTVR